ncbi:unnamed protein product [Somion occarium]|uniref:Uncharacterized protein n=1 Tax=Somion occarium TaxID=3059160 RepID=A0ABP1DQI1_9APHY
MITEPKQQEISSEDRQPGTPTDVVNTTCTSSMDHTPVVDLDVKQDASTLELLNFDILIHILSYQCENWLIHPAMMKTCHTLYTCGIALLLKSHINFGCNNESLLPMFLDFVRYDFSTRASYLRSLTICASHLAGVAKEHVDGFVRVVAAARNLENLTLFTHCYGRVFIDWSEAFPELASSIMPLTRMKRLKTIVAPHSLKMLEGLLSPLTMMELFFQRESSLDPTPLLRISGGSLQTLHLFGARALNGPFTCPHVETLMISDVLSGDIDHLPHFFPNLRKLRLVTGENMWSMVNSCNECLQQSSRPHKWTHLEHLEGSPSALSTAQVSCRVHHLEVSPIMAIHEVESIHQLVSNTTPSSLAIEINVFLSEDSAQAFVLGCIPESASEHLSRLSVSIVFESEHAESRLLEFGKILESMCTLGHRLPPLSHLCIHVSDRRIEADELIEVIEPASMMRELTAAGHPSLREITVYTGERDVPSGWKLDECSGKRSWIPMSVDETLALPVPFASWTRPAIAHY